VFTQKNLYSRFNMLQLMNDRVISFFWVLIALILLIVTLIGKKGEYFWHFVFALSSILLFHSYKIYTGYIRYFKKGYSYVPFVRE